MAWKKRAGWLEDSIAVPGRSVAGPGRTRGRLPTNSAQRLGQQALTQPTKIPKKRGPKPGSKVCVISAWFGTESTDSVESIFILQQKKLKLMLHGCMTICLSCQQNVSYYYYFFFLSLFRENHGWSLIPSQRLPSVALQNLTPAPCPRTTPPSPTLHSRLPQVFNPPTLTLHNHFDNSFEKENMMVGMSCRCSLRLPEQVREGGAPFRPEAYPAAPRSFWTGPSLLRAAAVRPGLCGLRPQPEHRLFLS